MADFSFEFFTLSAGSGWEETTLQDVFLRCLNGSLHDEIALRDPPDYLESLVLLATRIDN